MNTKPDPEWKMGDPAIPPLAAANLMRALPLNERNRLIADAGDKVFDGRALFGKPRSA